MIRVNIFYLYVLGIVAYLNPLNTAIAEEYLRKWPYPYSHVVSFTSDVDMQEPWFGEAFHQTMNEDLGLAISDSVWVQVATPLSGIMRPNLSFNRINNKIGSRGTFFLLLQQWHRGNIDHIHGWQDDAAPKVILFSSKEGTLTGNTEELNIDVAPVPLQGYPFANIRFFFSKQPSENFSITLIDTNGHQARISPLAIKQAAYFQIQQPKNQYSFNLLIGQNLNPLIQFSSTEFSLSHIKSIHFKDAAEKPLNDLRLFRVEMDNLSRESVFHQSTDLTRFNFFPILHSSHGGSTLHQDFCRKEHFYPHTIGSNVNTALECLADVPERHAYHVDILKEMGVRIILPYGSDNYPETYPNHLKPPSEPVRLYGQVYPEMYMLQRTVIKTSDLTKDFILKDSGSDSEDIKIKALTDKLIYESQDKTYFGADQGAHFGAYVYYAIAGLEKGREVNHMWYTHFGTIPYVKEFNSTPEAPLPNYIVEAAKMLSEHVYNYNGTKKLKERIWVIPASTHLRYMMTYPSLEKHTKINFDASTIEIFSYEDKTTKTIVPDVRFGTRDLHGATFYVKDPEKAKVSLDGKEVYSFTRNPIDDSGLSSITIFDDHLPTDILPSIETLNQQGNLVNNGIELISDKEKVFWSANKPGNVYIEYKPHELNLWNTSHIMLDWDIKKDNNSSVFVEITRADDQIIGIYENKKDALNAQAFWIVAPHYTKIGLAHDQLTFKISEQGLKKLPLLLGNIKKIKIGFNNAKKGDSIQINSFQAFRPNGNDSTHNNTFVIGGQALDENNSPLVGKVITLNNNSDIAQLSTLSDQQGYYTFFDVPKNATVQMHMDYQGKKIPPKIGSKFRVLKNELEINFILPPKPGQGK